MWPALHRVWVASSIIFCVGGVALGEPGSAADRAALRLFDGAPPAIPHDSSVGACSSCHAMRAVDIPSRGIAPPSPHGRTAGVGSAPCKQCHVERRSGDLFVRSTFRGLEQDLRPGRRAHPLAPPVIPHMVFMRENCVACHTGPTARAEIRTSHPERINCRQCHVERVTSGRFAAPAAGE